MNSPQSSPRLPYRGNDSVMGIEILSHLSDEQASLTSPRTVMPTLPTQSGLEPFSDHIVSGRRTSHASGSSLTDFSAGDPRGKARSW